MNLLMSAMSVRIILWKIKNKYTKQFRWQARFAKITGV